MHVLSRITYGGCLVLWGVLFCLPALSQAEESEPPATLNADSVSTALAGLAITWLEKTLPVWVHSLEAQLGEALQDSKQTSLTQILDQQALLGLLGRLTQQRFGDQVSELTFEIQPSGIRLSAQMGLGSSREVATTQFRIFLLGERITVELLELSIGSEPILRDYLKLVESVINQSIEKQPPRVRIQRMELQAGQMTVWTRSP